MNKFNRRQFALMVAGLSAAASFAPAPAFSAVKTWDRDLAWVKANGVSRHNWFVRGSGGATFRVAVDMEDFLRSDFQRLLFYGQKWERQPEFSGLSAHYGTMDANKAKNGINVLSGLSGSARRSSIWAVGWSEKTIHMVTPDGSPPSADCARGALAVIDWRYACRMANVDFIDLIEKSSASARLDRALLRLPTIRKNTAIYASSRAVAAMAIGGIRGSYRNIPIRSIDVLRDDEDLVI